MKNKFKIYINKNTLRIILLVLVCAIVTTAQKTVPEQVEAEKLQKNEPFIIKDVNILPNDFEKEKKQLIDGKVSSILIIPLIFNKKLKGAFGLSYTSKIKEWNQEDINLLKFIGEIFMNAFSLFIHV